MENINHTLFLWLNAPAHPHAPMLTIAVILAEYLIWFVPTLIGLGWLRGDEHHRKGLLMATAAGLTGLLFNQVIGTFYGHPRPFMIGLGHTFLSHVADSSFPSDHLTLWWSVAFAFLLSGNLRRTGVLMAFIGLPMAWARIYLGVHFPFDMIGSLGVSALCAWLAWRISRWYLPTIFRWTVRLYRIFFCKLIQLGWVRG